jgi:rubredoxin
MVTPPSRKALAPRPEMVWIEKERFRGWACSECAWVFNPSVWPTGNSIAEMKQSYEQQRDNEFMSHVCAKHRKAQERNSAGETQLR